MDADKDHDRNSGFDIKLNDFIITECTACVVWNAGDENLGDAKHVC
jgi:hypothetical protein